MLRRWCFAVCNITVSRERRERVQLAPRSNFSFCYEMWTKCPCMWNTNFSDNTKCVKHSVILPSIDDGRGICSNVLIGYNLEYELLVVTLGTQLSQVSLKGFGEKFYLVKRISWSSHMKIISFAFLIIKFNRWTTGTRHDSRSLMIDTFGMVVRYVSWWILQVGIHLIK